MQETNKFTCCMKTNEIEKKLTEISAKIENELHKQRQDLLSTPLKIGQITFDSNQMLRLLTLIDTLKNTETQQSYVQILEGVSTNSIRQKKLDIEPLREWPLAKHLIYRDFKLQLLLFQTRNCAHSMFNNSKNKGFLI